MRVAFITPNLPHYRSNLYKILGDSDVIDLVNYSDYKESNGIRSVDTQQLREFRELRNIRLGPLYWQRGIFGAVLDRSVHTYVFTGDVRFLSTWIGAFVARMRGKPVYFWTIGWHRPESGVRSMVRTSFYKIAHKLLVYADVGKEFGVQQGYPEDRMEVVYNSVTGLEEIDSNATITTEKEDAVGAVIRLNPVKNLSLLFDAVHLLKKRGKSIKIILAGDGPERAALQDKANDLGIECEFLGAVYDPSRISDVYKRIKVTVVPSAAGLTAVQSLAHGVPVVTDDDEYSQMPEAISVIPGVTGARFLAGDAQALADAISLWIQKVADNPAEVAAQCEREVERRWTPAAQASRMLESIGAMSAS